MNQLSLISLSSGFIFVVVGLILRFFPPAKINWVYGYRTGTSMRNQETWNRANRYAAQLLWQFGLLLLVIGGITFLLPPSPLTGILAGVVVFITLVALTFYLTEKHLEKHFDKNGNPKS
jgi:uncharacterized membrane protein